ncbi:DnaJ domain-containing protein [filamentous cyanobacterium LEGE 11480]|uniref:DnaJ domain-containing protein n=1 Tax=Romeriopsis navalis LEGE 11480 TaxID=2777977 RepID=A0A928VTA8_9CYAN|nr:DnaJ domain-containing protein [Romeriopsis navalis]MBE9032651.1 DnaJ domain-containing protein [Romeriopsis navalis LEGE 11480]
MALQIDKGLFSADFMDHYAILGIPLDIDPKEIRKVYLKIARRLHPDSSALTNDGDRQIASQLLSKWVNPAWENLSQEKNRTEYNLLIKMKGQSAIGASSAQTVHLNSIAQQLLAAPNPDFFYRSALSDLSKKQFVQLDQAMEMTGRISELNLAYIMRKQSSGENTISSTRPLYTVGASFSETPAQRQAQEQAQAEEPRVPIRQSLAAPYFRRAEGYYKKSDYVRAIRELRDGLAIDTTHGPSHSMLGMAYMNQKQPTMAKIHFNKALAINPEDEQAQVGKQALARMNAANNASQEAPKKSSGGFLGGLFGRKK